MHTQTHTRFWRSPSVCSVAPNKQNKNETGAHSTHTHTHSYAVVHIIFCSDLCVFATGRKVPNVRRIFLATYVADNHEYKDDDRFDHMLLLACQWQNIDSARQYNNFKLEHNGVKCLVLDVVRKIRCHSFSINITQY